MNEVEMLVTAVEKFSNVKNIPGNQVFRVFSEKGVLDFLLGSYEIFKDMDEGFLLGVIDGYIENTVDSDEQDYVHYQERKASIPVIVQILSEHLKMEPLKVLKEFYLSSIGKQFALDESGYYAKKPEEVAELFLEEYK